MTAIEEPGAMEAGGRGAPLIRFVAQVGSTNDELMRAPLGTSPCAPVVLWAGRQTAGRGRRGRTWFSADGDALTFSVALERPVGDPAPGLSGLSLAVGVALAEALAGFGCALSLKWPNDLWRDGRKVGGVLIETRRDHALERVVVGVGLNLVAPRLPVVAGAGAAQVPPPVPAGGLFDRPVSEERARAIVVASAQAIVAAYRLFIAQGFVAFRERWLRLDALQGALVQLSEGGRLLAQGEAVGIGDAGELRLRSAEGTREFTLGDVSLRPAAPPG